MNALYRLLYANRTLHGHLDDGGVAAAWLGVVDELSAL